MPGVNKASIAFNRLFISLIIDLLTRMEYNVTRAYEGNVFALQPHKIINLNRYI